MRLTLHARGPCPADEVWERYADPARWSGWAPYITGVECSDPRIRPGSTGRVRGPLGVAATFAVTAVDAGARTWSWDVALGPVRLSLDHGVRSAGGGTRTWLVVDGPPPVVLPYAVPARVSLEMLVRRGA
ncbi:SRPBCC family protein [Pseudonocardia sp. HH130630-07]|uniref:SRPBCC family protein n=1 Tax=Pseudonocardia sp. HH130630-07 TaxID=1690815 RepID=UPI000814FAD5|nr:SRPBCC family protein [Pseudonocardia sp. HH130630-07]ANY09284.1 polyketide cyclase [Pseudonocardia sp. HH130630-07]